MDSLQADQFQFAQKGSFSPGIVDVQKSIDILQQGRNKLVAGGESHSHLLGQVQVLVKHALDGTNGNLKDVHKASQIHGKCLDRRLRVKSTSSNEQAELSSDVLLDRAIGMHLLREGQFPVAAAFLSEMTEASTPEMQRQSSLEPTPGSLKGEFLQMYQILHEMQSNRNLQPAMDWTKSRSRALQIRGSNLEFDLAQLQYIWLFAGDTSQPSPTKRRQAAISYARDAFSCFGVRYLREIQQLMAAMAFCSDVTSSPYARLFRSAGGWEQVALSFTREYCSLLGLSADSPLYIATTAGATALPMLEKLRNIMKEKRTEWTTEHELPVEIPLPAAYRFHSIFVCPVSKEQTTDKNPPMLLPCGHVIAQESLARLSKIAKFKCPYCPEESHHSQARKVLL